MAQGDSGQPQARGRTFPLCTPGEGRVPGTSHAGRQGQHLLTSKSWVFFAIRDSYRVQSAALTSPTPMRNPKLGMADQQAESQCAVLALKDISQGNLTRLALLFLFLQKKLKHRDMEWSDFSHTVPIKPLCQNMAHQEADTHAHPLSVPCLVRAPNNGGSLSPAWGPR